jgi:pimeloyl-ACP methyl ester carboxylesterase
MRHSDSLVAHLGAAVLPWHRVSGLTLLLASLLTIAYPNALRAQDPTSVVSKNTRLETFELAPLGTIHVMVPTPTIKSVAIFVSGDGGWNDGVTDMAQLLANQGALVIGMDVVPYLQALNNGAAACASVVSDFEKLMQSIRERYPGSEFMQPILVGYSSGATLAYAVVAQAPKERFRGVMTLGFCDTLEIQRPLCTGRTLALHRAADGLHFLPTHLNVPWVVLHGSVDQACTINEVTRFAEAVPARLVALPKVGHGYAVARRWQPQYVSAYNDLAGTNAKRGKAKPSLRQ